MDSLVDLLANNDVVKALAAVGSLVALAVFAYQLWKRASGYFARHLEKTASRNITDARKGIQNPSYLMATLFYHMILMLFFVWFYYLFDEIYDAAQAIPDQGFVSQLIIWTARALKLILTILLVDRGANVWLVSRRVIRETNEGTDP